MDAEEVPRMSGALPQTDPANESQGSANLLGVPTGQEHSRSPSVLNDVKIDDEAEGEAANEATGEAVSELSKSQQKKLKRQQKWEDGREDRKRRRKEKRHNKQIQKRAAKQEGADGVDGAKTDETPVVPKEHVMVPVSLIFDCAFESYMRETELISLASQITRSYAANRTAARQTRLYISSWQGKLRTRYETLLSNQHKRWQHAYFVEDDFMEAGRQAEAAMRAEDGGVIVDVLETKADQNEEDKVEDQGSVVYLSSDSPHTLTKLEPYTSYVIGGLVDKNREKGLCYRRAQEHGIRTAKLPIGEYMVMASRQVLTTNHVVEIMLHWLETGDWATAFERVIPKRKGGRLREVAGEAEAEAEEAEEAEEAQEQEAQETEEAEAQETHEQS